MPVSSPRTLMDAEGREFLNEFVLGPGLSASKNAIKNVHFGAYRADFLDSLHLEGMLYPAMFESQPLGPDSH
jgi:hypothetical protein